LLAIGDELEHVGMELKKASHLFPAIEDAARDAEELEPC